MQTDIVMGVPGPARKTPEFLAASLGNSILGQFGMYGRIGQVVREQGLRVDPASAVIHVDGERIASAPGTAVYLLNKPRGMHTTMSDPAGKSPVVSMSSGSHGATSASTVATLPSMGASAAMTQRRRMLASFTE